ncbi:MAG TPA: Ig-like domain-containing protein, partial [Nevskiaceae bacterium]|nr:Ig-like domain-containing protein [Nevskiaceae bacterium]
MKKLHGLLALALVTLAGCGDGGIQSPDFTPELTGVVITTAEPVTVPAGRTVQIEGVGVFTAPPGSEDPTFQDETELEWSSSNDNLATVDGNGLVTGVAEGTVTITAAKKDFSDTIEVTIGAAVLTGIEVQPG